MKKEKNKWRKEKKGFMEALRTQGSDTSDVPLKSTRTDNMKFGEAFKHFRNQGVDTFTWQGKKYTTKHKGE